MGSRLASPSGQWRARSQRPPANHDQSDQRAKASVSVHVSVRTQIQVGVFRINSVSTQNLPIEGL